MNKAWRWLAVIAVLALLGLGAWQLMVYLAIPKTPAEALAAARKEEARQNAVMAVKQTEGVLTPQDKSRHVDTIVDAYEKVERQFPKTPEVEEADWRVLQLREENSTSPEARISLAEKFLDKHTSTTRVADLRWKIAELTHREVKKLLDAIKLYEGFAASFREDSRAPEALFRVGQIYEEIKEFARAVEAYQRVAKEFPRSPVADQAQFRAGSLLAERLEKKEEAQAAFEQVERNAPEGSRIKAQAGEQRRRLATEADQDEQQKTRRKYYGGVQESAALDQFLDKIDSPPFIRLRTQGMDLVGTSATIEVVPVERAFNSRAELQILATESTSIMTMMLASPLKVGGLKVNLGQGNKEYKFQRQDDFLFVDFDADSVPVGTTFTVELDYKGVCKDSWGMSTISTTSTMLVGNFLLPSLNLGDGRPIFLDVSVPRGWTAIATGLPQTPVPPAPEGQVRTLWSNPQSVFWTGLVVGPYKSYPADYESTVSGRRIGVAMHLLPGMSDRSAEVYLERLPHILSFYEGLLGPFPYDKLDVAQVYGFPGGLASPGLIMLGPGAFVKPEVPAYFLAHEVSHAWFGNLVTLDLSPGSPIWLSEGFAEYLDALYHEHDNGPGSIARTMRDRATQFYTMTLRIQERALADLRGNISAMAPSSYTKGAFVLHMLRGTMGDEAFVSMMRLIVDRHQGQLFTLPALEKAAQEASGENLDWFFDQWVRKTGIPRLELADACLIDGEGGAKDLSVVIVQKGPRNFRMPLDIELELEGGTTVMTRVDVRETTSLAVLKTKVRPLKVRIDPQSWILKHPRSEEWERVVGDACTTAGLTAVETREIPRPAHLGGSLAIWKRGSEAPGKVSQTDVPASAAQGTSRGDNPTTPTNSARRNRRSTR